MDLDLWVTAGAVLWGAAAGVLVPRAAYRLSVEPGQPWRDRCPDGHPIGGWVGPARCADGRPYGPGTALVCGATALVCAVLALATGTRPELLVWLLIAPVGVLLTIVDFRVQRLPDVLTLPLAALAPLLLGAAAAMPEHAGRWPTALLGALVLGVGYFLLFLVNPNGMGFGDVKLAPDSGRCSAGTACPPWCSGRSPGSSSAGCTASRSSSPAGPGAGPRSRSGRFSSPARSSGC